MSRIGPSPNIAELQYSLAPQRLVQVGGSDERTRQDEKTISIQSPLTVGLFAGKWCSYAAGPDLAHDQRQEDGGALVFESDPVSESFEVLGAPMLEVIVEANRPIAILAARLSDVRPNDEATRVTYGLLNLSHSDGSADPQSLEPGQPYQVRFRLNELAHVFPRGHEYASRFRRLIGPSHGRHPSPSVSHSICRRVS